MTLVETAWLSLALFSWLLVLMSIVLLRLNCVQSIYTRRLRSVCCLFKALYCSEYIVFNVFPPGGLAAQSCHLHWPHHSGELSHNHVLILVWRCWNYRKKYLTIKFGFWCKLDSDVNYCKYNSLETTPQPMCQDFAWKQQGPSGKIFSWWAMIICLKLV